MKAQNRKVVQAVMKSPSPDIAHRSIIANTRSPVNQIKDYIKMRQSSNSPKSMTTSFHQITKSHSSENQQTNKLKKYIQELEHKIMFLQRIHISHDQLALINQSLNNQIAQLRTELRQQKQRTHSNASRNNSPNKIKPISPKNGGKGVSLVRNAVLNANPQIQNIPQPTQSDSILRQFNERIVKMSEENKRLTKKLKQLKDQTDFLQKQNSLLRLKGASQAVPHYPSSNQINSFKKYFAEEADRIAIYYQRINEEKFLKLKTKLNQVEAQLSKVTQKQNQKKIYTRSNTPNELKANVSMDTNFRSDNQDQGPSSLPANKYNMVESKYTTSPSEFKAFTLDTSPIRVLEEEKDKIKRQNDYLTRKASELQKQLRNALMTNDSLQKRLRKLQAQTHNVSQEKKNLSDSNFSLYKTAQQKNEYLQTELAKKNASIKHNENRINELEQNLNKMKDLNNAMGKDYEKSIEQQKQKNIKLQSDIQHYQNQITFFQENYMAKERYFFLQKQLKQMKDSYSRYKVDFERYLELVLEIRYSITGEGVDQCLKDIEKKWEGYDDMELEIIKIHECYEALIQNLKKKLLQKEQRIGQLQKENQVLFQSNQETMKQLQKLERAVNEYREPVRSKMSEQELRQRMAIHQSGAKSREGCQIREYINKTVSKISNLQNEIQMAIKVNYSDRKMVSSIKQNINPVEADSMYRTQERSTRYQLGGQDGDNDNENVQDEDVHMTHQ